MKSIYYFNKIIASSKISHLNLYASYIFLFILHASCIFQIWNYVNTK